MAALARRGGMSLPRARSTRTMYGVLAVIGSIIASNASPTAPLPSCKSYASTGIRERERGGRARRVSDANRGVCRARRAHVRLTIADVDEQIEASFVEQVRQRLVVDDAEVAQPATAQRGRLGEARGRARGRRARHRRPAVGGAHAVVEGGAGRQPVQRRHGARVLAARGRVRPRPHARGRRRRQRRRRRAVLGALRVGARASQRPLHKQARGVRAHAQVHRRHRPRGGRQRAARGKGQDACARERACVK